MRHGRLVGLVVAATALVLLAGTAGAVGGVAGSDTGGTVATAADNQSDGDAPPDPEEDVLGWENGVWYNESIDVTPSDGYDRTEIERIVSRSMARVERVRGLEFEETPNVELITRDEYRAFTDGIYGNLTDTTTKQRLHQNTKFEALFLVGEDDSYFADFVANQGSVASAFHVNEDIPEYGFEEGDIGVVVSSDGRATELQESTLGHELLHFVQNNRFDNSQFSGGPTEEAANVNTSLVEGDATWVGQTYGERCGDEWDCLPSSESGQSTFANFGLVLYGLGPYSNTATLFEHVREEGGVEAMNALYENPPESTEQFLHPDEYPDDEPVDVSYEDRSGDAWEMQTFEDGVDYATFGEAGIFTMLYYPSYNTRSRVEIDPRHIFDGAQGNTYVRFDFVHPASTGWDGDKLFVYTNASSAETNETGYVWKTVWESPDEAAEFADAYTTILREYGDAVADRQDTYRVPEGSPFEDAFYVEVSGDTVTIVNAPTVGALAEVRRGAAPRAEATTETTTDDTQTATTTATSTAGGDGTDDGDGQAQPGFGVGLAVVALLAAVFLLRRRD
ncbi:hypothetical protein BRD10_00090 [Halobacteriales archaeon SW_12_71_31]|nr:MAG: hypothetical protein BRD10_00090 [Halobacteriales archaeon SW_12_71_31]